MRFWPLSPRFIRARPHLAKPFGNFCFSNWSHDSVGCDGKLVLAWPYRHHRLGEDLGNSLASFLASVLAHFRGLFREGFSAFAAQTSSDPFAAGESANPTKSRHLSHADEADQSDIAIFKSGQISGFNRLVLRHKDRVHSLCFRLLGRNEDALDVAQEVFVRIHRALPKFRGDAKFSTWLHTIAVNACRNRQATTAWRESHRHQSLDTAEEWLAAENRGGDLDWHAPAADITGTSAGLAQGKASPASPMGASQEWSSGSPELDLRRKRREALLQRALNSLPNDFREAMVLRDVEGKSYEDIAAMTGWETGTVRSRIFRAREKLRELLQRGWE